MTIFRLDRPFVTGLWFGLGMFLSPLLGILILIGFAAALGTGSGIGHMLYNLPQNLGAP